jgi:hypothetical protein
VWYLIALQTVVEPTFYQRILAARSPSVARTGVLVSVALWFVFDALTVTAGLAARVVLPDLADPLQAYPALAHAVLPPPLAALFTISLLAIVMSTLDSYLFLAGATLGYDFRSRRGRRAGHAGFDPARAGDLGSHGGRGRRSLRFRGRGLAPRRYGPHVLTPPACRGGSLSAPMAPGRRRGPRGHRGCGRYRRHVVGPGPWGTYPLNTEPMFPALAVSAALCWPLGGLFRRSEPPR